MELHSGEELGVDVRTNHGLYDRPYHPQGWHPDDLGGKLADPAMDWGLLLVTLAFLLEKDNLSALQSAGSSSVDKSKVRRPTGSESRFLSSSSLMRFLIFIDCTGFGEMCRGQRYKTRRPPSRTAREGNMG